MDIRQLLNKYKVYDDYSTSVALFLKFGNCTIRVVANDGGIVKWLEQYFNHFVVSAQKEDIVLSVHQAPEFNLSETFTIKQPDPGKTKVKEEYFDLTDGRVVRKRLTGMIFIFGRRTHVAVGPCLENMNQVVNFINNRYIQWLLCRGCLLGHASAVTAENQGLAIAGFSGAGKSTLALHLMDKGLRFVSNDRLMIEKNGQGVDMYGVAKLPRINPGTAINIPVLTDLIPEDRRKHFTALPVEELWHIEEKYDVPIDTCYGPDRFILNATMSALVILNWQPGAGEMVVSKVKSDQMKKSLLQAFMKSTGLFFYPDTECQMPDPSVEKYAQFLSETDMWEFSGGADFDQAAHVCLSILEDRVDA